MWYMVLSIAITALVAIVAHYRAYRDGFCGDHLEAAGASLVYSIVTAVILFVVGYPLLGFTTGLYPDYSEGVREGYVTKLCTRGLIYKTGEGELQVGTGELAGLKQPWHFSVSDYVVWVKLQTNIGKHVRLTYKEWVFQPFWKGDSDYEIIDVEVLK